MPIPKKSEEMAHKYFLKYQQKIEQLLADLHDKTEQSISNIISRNINSSGTIDVFKLNKIVDEYMTNELNIYRKDLYAQIKTAIDDSSALGVRAILGATEPQRKATAFIWQNISDKIRKNIINKRSIEDGLTLSDRVWKLTDDNIHQLKKIISSDILQGESAAKISRDIRSYLKQPKTLRGRIKDLLQPGQGTYKSAYKNAMRVTRTETNRAYIDAQKETAETLGYKLQFQISGSHPEIDICDEYQGRIFEPSDFPAPLHPHCMCFALTVLG